MSHRWSRPAGKKLNKRAVQSRQVTNVKKFGSLYNVTSDEEDGQAGNAKSQRKLNKSPVVLNESAPETYVKVLGKREEPNFTHQQVHIHVWNRRLYNREQTKR